MRRITSLLLTLALCLSLLPGTALAAEGRPNLVLDPGQTGDIHSNTISANTGFFGNIIWVGQPGESEPEKLTVQLLIQGPDGEEHTQETQLYPGKNYANFYNNRVFGYEFVSIRPDTQYELSADNTLTFDLQQDSVITVRRYYLDIDYQITYDLNGAGDTQTVRVKNGTAPTRPADPSLPGYRFLGWYTGTAGTDGYLRKYCRFDFSQRIREDQTLYAMWEQEASSAYTITFDPNGGNVSPTSKQTDAEGRVPGGYPTPTREGYAFLGWFTGDGYQPKDTEIWSGNQVLTAKWEKAGGARVTFYPNGGRITRFLGVTVPESTPGSAPFYIGGSGETGVDMNSGWGWTAAGESGLSLPTVERKGYAFDGWYAVSGPQANQAGDGKLTDFTGLTRVSEASRYPQGVELAARWTAGQTYKVSFHLNGMPGKTPQDQEVVSGGTVQLPDVAVPDRGVTYYGWYLLENGSLTKPWKADTPVERDIDLYAAWEAKRIEEEDTFQFNNSEKNFATYQISDTYWKYLISGEPTSARAYIQAQRDQAWGGSCFGMSAVYCMGRAGQIGLGTFQGGASRLWDLKTPRQSQNIQDLINFYMLAQFTSSTIQYYQPYFFTERYEDRPLADRYRMIVSGIEQKPNFALLGFDFGEDSGHAVVARGVSRGNDGNYHIEIWDPNYPSTFGELIVSGDYGGAWFGDKTMNSGAYNVNTELSYLMPISQKNQHYDAKNLEAAFGGQGGAAASRSGGLLLSSSVGDFSVSAADGRGAVVKNGRKVSGDLPLARNAPMTGSEDGYRFLIGAKTLDGLTVTVGGKQAEVEVVSGELLARVNAGNLNTVKISGGGVTTSCSAAAQQEITLVSDALGSTWNKVTVSGRDTAISLSAADGRLTLTSNASLTVQGENVDSQKASGQQAVAASPAGTAVAMESLGTGGAAQPSAANPFTDVASGAYYYDAVLWAVQKGVTGGTSATTFSPGNPCTRAQIVTFLWRAAGSPKPSSSANPFTDVKEGAYYSDAVLWAAEKGITGGTSATTFSPGASCTRGQTVTFLYRAAGSPKTESGANPFADVKEGAYCYDAVLWAVGKGITSGATPTTFRPDATVTRGQTVTFLYRSQGK